MSQSPQQLLNEALKMPLADRGQLAALLIESLESDVDDGVDEAWSEEISRRVQEIDAGRVRMIPWSEVRQRLRGQDAPTSSGESRYEIGSRAKLTHQSSVPNH